MPDTLPRLYQDEALSFLRIFTDPERKKLSDADRATWDAEQLKNAEMQGRRILNSRAGQIGQNAFDPIAVAEALITEQHIQEPDKLLSILKKSFRIDGVTGYFAKETMPVIVGLAHLLAQNPENKTPVCLVEGDFVNMGGCNDSHINRVGTDKLLRTVCDLTKKAFEDYAEKNHIRMELQPIRAGGDELRLVVYGMKKEQVDEVLNQRIHPQVNLLAAQFGVHDIPHKKPKLPGFGVAFAAVDLAKEKNPAHIREILDIGIENRKVDDGLLRAGMIDEPSVEKYLKEFLKKKIVPAKEFYLLKEKLLKQVMQRDIKGHWDDLIAKDGIYHNEFKKYDNANPHDFFNDVKRQYKDSVQARLGEINFTPKPNDPIPFSGESLHPEVTKRIEAPEVLRLRRALRAFGFSDLANADKNLFKWDEKKRRYNLERPPEMHNDLPEKNRLQRMVIDLMMEVFDAPDPASRCKTTNFMVQDIQNFMKEHGPVRVAHFELANINGLNHISYDLADAALRETGKFIQEELRKRSKYQDMHGDKQDLGTHIMDMVFHEGGGKFKIVLPKNYPTDQLQATAAAVNRRIHDEICDQHIVSFAKRTYAYRGKNGERQAESDRKIEALEKRLGQINKMHTQNMLWMSDIPHPKDPGIMLSLNHYDKDTVITTRDDIARRLQDISSKAEHAIAKSRKDEVIGIGA